MVSDNLRPVINRREKNMHGSTLLEHTLFAVTLAAMAFLCLEALAFAVQTL